MIFIDLAVFLLNGTTRCIVCHQTTTQVGGRCYARLLNQSATKKPPDPVEQLHWTSIHRKNHWTSIHRKNDSYHFFSAYYDNRKPAPHRPAVIVMGYISKNTKKTDLYCVFKFPNGSIMCSRTPGHWRYPGDCLAPSIWENTLHLYCDVDSVDDEPPISVMISTSMNYKRTSTSGEILVRNRYISKETDIAGKFGVCLGGAVIQSTTKQIFLQSLIEFIEMSQILGASLITLYIGSMTLDPSVLLSRYPDTVRIIQWRTFDADSLYYHGQILINSDCFYRSMYEVEYLALIDLDEMILPRTHSTWGEMVKNISSLAGKYASFKFQHAFFSTNHPPTQLKMPNYCNGFTVPKYLTKTEKTICESQPLWYRTKTISKPRLILKTGIHRMCKAMKGYNTTYKVPVEIGINAHYRHQVPHDCGNIYTREDEIAMKFAHKLMRNICS